MKMDMLLAETLIEIDKFIGSEVSSINSLLDYFAKVAYVADQSHNDALDVYELNEILHKLLAAIENNDHDLLIDLLQLEVKPLLEHWNKQL